jgi:L-threonylcarbamoyladenylate synthase
MVVYRGSRDLVEKEIQRVKDQRQAEGRKVGLVIFEENNYLEAAHTFFAKMRVMDDLGMDLILATAVDDEDPIGFAVMNRMLKSAGYHVIDL